MQETLDPALTRPGRFDRRVAVPMPDVRGRLEILEHYLKVTSCFPITSIDGIASVKTCSHCLSSAETHFYCRQAYLNTRRQDFSCTYPAHHKVESISIIISMVFIVTVSYPCHHHYHHYCFIIIVNIKNQLFWGCRTSPGTAQSMQQSWRARPRDSAEQS